MSKCEHEHDGTCLLNECLYGDFIQEDDSRFDTGRLCLCPNVEHYRTAFLKGKAAALKPIKDLLNSNTAEIYFRKKVEDIINEN